MSKFTSFEAKKLFKLYKHAAKKRDESKAQEVRRGFLKFWYGFAAASIKTRSNRDVKDFGKSNSRLSRWKTRLMIQFFSLQRTQNRPAPQSQRTPQDSSGMSRKHLCDLVPQRSSNNLKRQMEGGNSSHLGPGGKVPRMDRTNSGSSSHSGGRHSGGGDGYDPRRSSFSHSDRVSGSTKDRPRDG